MAYFLSPLRKNKGMAKSAAEVGRAQQLEKSESSTPESSPRHKLHQRHRNQLRPRGGADSYPDTPKRLKSGGVQSLLNSLKTKLTWKSRHSSFRRWGREKSTSQPDVRSHQSTSAGAVGLQRSLGCEDAAGKEKCASTNASPLLMRRIRVDGGNKPCDLVDIDNHHWREHGPQDAPLTPRAVPRRTRDDDSSDADEFDDCPSPVETFCLMSSNQHGDDGKAEKDRRRSSDNWKSQRPQHSGLTAGSIIRRLSSTPPAAGSIQRHLSSANQPRTVTEGEELSENKSSVPCGSPSFSVISGGSSAASPPVSAGSTGSTNSKAAKTQQSLRSRAREAWQQQVHPQRSLSILQGSSAGGSRDPCSITPGELRDALPPTHGDKEKRQDLRKHPFFQLHIHLKRGVNLVAMDSCGTSDPYVKFKIGGKLMYKSKIVYKDLNPYWDEYFTLPIEDAFEPILVKVFDYDWGFQDDFMGSASIDMSRFELYKPAELELPLAIPNREDPAAGDLHLTATLYPKSQEDWEEVRRYCLGSMMYYLKMHG